MKKISITVVSLATMAGFALAQAPKADTKAGAGSAAPKAPAAGSAAGSAKAPAAAGSAAGSAAGAAAGSAAAPKMEMPKPPAEIKDAIKMMGNRQTCTGKSWGGPDMKTEMKATGTSTNALALDGWAIKSTMNMTMGEGKQKMVFKMEGYKTWDAKLGKWHDISAANDGSVMVGLTEVKDGKLESNSDVLGGMMAGKFRDHGDMTDPKAGFKMWGEFSADNGKTWNKVYEMTCKK